MRHSELAHVVIRVPFGKQRYLLLRKNRKWHDWSLVGGHVEPGEEGDWACTAIRECEEELAPLKYMTDFIVVPLLRQPIRWGPVASRSAHGALTCYTAQLFALEFRRSPEECLARLPSEDFLMMPEERVPYANSGAGFLDVIRRGLPTGFSQVPVSWQGTIDRAKISIPEAKRVGTRGTGRRFSKTVGHPSRRAS
jgi:hypothetical protein